MDLVARRVLVAFTAAWVCGLATTAGAGTITYANRVAFQAALGASVTDTYSAPGYQTGDSVDNLVFDVFTNAAMSAVVGETDYQTTEFSNNNVIQHSVNDNYCAGCNGSFLLTFTSTSVGNASGVYGVGFDFHNDGSYHAFVTFADATTADYLLPSAPFTPGAFTGFYGITSDLGITSIHLGLANGMATNSGSFALDNLTIGAESTQAVPDPASSLSLLMLGMGGLVAARRWDRR